MAVNADGNMPYDICEDESALDYIESEMAKNGVTQQLIDETRAATERVMLNDMKRIAASGGDLELYDNQGATPVKIFKCSYRNYWNNCIVIVLVAYSSS